MYEFIDLHMLLMLPCSLLQKKIEIWKCSIKHGQMILVHTAVQALYNSGHVTNAL